jgi:hypothetical protein
MSCPLSVFLGDILPECYCAGKRNEFNVQFLLLFSLLYWVGLTFQAILHELGHLVGGAISGYKLLFEKINPHGGHALHNFNCDSFVLYDKPTERV